MKRELRVLASPDCQHRAVEIADQKRLDAHNSGRRARNVQGQRGPHDLQKTNRH